YKRRVEMSSGTPKGLVSFGLRTAGTWSGRGSRPSRRTFSRRERYEVRSSSLAFDLAVVAFDQGTGFAAIHELKSNLAHTRSIRKAAMPAQPSSPATLFPL